jgi:glutamate 5-kinase
VQKQALAAVGQAFLMRYYDDFFSTLGKRCAQVLLTLENLAVRSQYLNARNTFDALFALGVIPVVNENDTVAVEELKWGDNDTLSAQVAALVSAQWLFLLTDVDGLYTANPQRDPSATRIPVVEDIGALSADVSQAGTQWGTGGMVTKLTAARLASAAGCRTVICKSDAPDAVARCLGGESVGTVFLPVPAAAKGRKRWILALPPRGELRLDGGAVRALAARKSLFPSGVMSASGEFNPQDALRLCDEDGRELARGLVNYAASEVARLLGKSSRDTESVLGYTGVCELVHRDNICFTALMPEAASEGEEEGGEEEGAAAAPAAS